MKSETAKILACPLFIFLICLSYDVYCQSVTGRVYDVLAKKAVPGATIKNVSNKHLTLSDSSGNFKIKAMPGDTIITHGLSYTNDTLLIGSFKNYQIFLANEFQPLEEVRVYSPAQSSLKIPASPFHGQSMVYKYDYGGDEIGGVVFRLWYWKKDEKKRLKKLRLEEEYSADLKIARLFTEENLAKYLPLQSQELKKFLNLYTPTAKHFNEFDSNLALYLNHYYKIFILQKEAE